MIISHKHKFVFLKTEKTAGTTLEILLSTICGKNDIITPVSGEDEDLRQQQGGLSARNYYMPYSCYTKRDWYNLLCLRKKKKFYNHITAREVKSCIGDEIWNSYFKFCFERNPWDKAISQYFYRKGDERYNRIYDYIQSGELSKIKGYDMYSINGLVAVDKIYKMEKLEDALKDISVQLNLEKQLKLPEFKAKGNYRKEKKSYKELLSLKEKELIEIMFAREIRLLNYTF